VNPSLAIVCGREVSTIKNVIGKKLDIGTIKYVSLLLLTFKFRGIHNFA